MRQVSTVAEFRAALRAAPRPLGLVPTMGALHEGHLSLIRAARGECATTAASIFVNPAQFGVGEDFDTYPRPLASDLAKLESEGVDMAFTPSVEEMYPEGFAVTVRVAGPAEPLEGVARPGHFDGVATVVAKLFAQASPDRAYFGRKDGQQIAVVKRLARDLDLPVEIVAAPTARESDGLAVSSRNARLTAEQRAASPALYRGLSAARDLFRAGRQDSWEVEAACRRIIEAEPLIDAIDYVAVVNPETMKPPTEAGERLLVAAARMGSVRLLDNVVLD